jgi:hypothetical protein
MVLILLDAILLTVTSRVAQPRHVKQSTYWKNVTTSVISIHSIRTHDQQADYPMKPVNEEILTK